MVYGGSNGFPFSRFKGGRRELYKSQHRETAWIRKNKKGTSLAVQWLRLCNSTAGGTGSIPGWGTNILHSHAVQWGKKIIQGESKINMCLLAVQIKWFQAFSKTAAAAKSLQSCPTLCDPIDGSPPGSPVPGILHARTLEWVAISFSNAGKWKVKGKSLSRVQLVATLWTTAYQAPPSMGFSRQEYWSGVPLPSLF